MRVGWGCIAAFLVGSSAPQLAAQAQAQAQAHASPALAVVPLIGAARFSRPQHPETGAKSAGHLLLGVAMEREVHSALVVLSVARGFQPFACGGGCAPDGSATELSVLWPVLRAYDERSDVALGGTLAHHNFDGDRVTLGAVATVGATRGFGPRLMFRYAVLGRSGDRGHPAAWVGIRFGR